MEFYNRKPYELIAIQYSLLSFDGEGRVDVDDFEKGMQLGVEMLTPIESDPSHPNVVDAKGLFAIKRYHDRYSWRPSKEIEMAIIEAIFDKTI